jgi:ADP-ribosylglycohydrolase
MRVAPLGAYFADDLSIVPEQAAKSARVTHFHPEGIAGAIAVAVAAAVASNHEGNDPMDVPKLIWEAVLDLTPESVVRNRLSQASNFLTENASMVARELGNGSEISAQDTVPFCIWSACKYLGDFREAIFSTIEVGGDCDTNCAIVGGIIGAYAKPNDIPQDWLNARESMI